jgi:hypothetical protein
MSGAPEILLARKNDCLWITINREECRNAINAAVIAGIHGAVETAAADPALRAVSPYFRRHPTSRRPISAVLPVSSAGSAFR